MVERASRLLRPPPGWAVAPHAGDRPEPAVALHLHGVDEAGAGLGQDGVLLVGEDRLPQPLRRRGHRALLSDPAGCHRASHSSAAQSHPYKLELTSPDSEDWSLTDERIFVRVPEEWGE